MTDPARSATFDTNVLVSGFLSPSGPPARIVEWLAAGVLRAVVDARIADEYETVLKRPELKLPPSDVRPVLGRILQVALWITVPPDGAVAGLPDADDAPFAECALAARTLLVKDNKRHFPRSVVGDLLVVSPRTFVERARAGGSSQ